VVRGVFSRRKKKTIARRDKIDEMIRRLAASEKESSKKHLYMWMTLFGEEEGIKRKN